jgi:putative tricarboxylic transport membrane protein
MSEQHFRRALAISEGDVSVFVTRPLAAVLLVAAGAVMLGPQLVKRWTPSTSS